MRKLRLLGLGWIVWAAGCPGEAGHPMAAPPASSTATASSGVGAPRLLTFAELGGWTYELPAEVGQRPKEGQVPARVLALHGAQVRIQGYLHGTEEEAEAEASDFVLLPDHDACGAPPEMNGWVHVRLKDGRRFTPRHGAKVEVVGRLEVGELLEGDLVLSIYRLEADELKLAE